MTKIRVACFSLKDDDSRLMVIFQDNLGNLVPDSCLDFIGAKNDGGTGDNWSYEMCKPPFKS